MRRIQATLFVFAFLAAACSGQPHPKTITKQMGQPILPYGLFISIENNPKVDKLFPNYRVLTVAITNRGMKPFTLSAEKDSWKIQDVKGKWTQAINTFRLDKPELWNRIPEEVQKMIDYPAVVPSTYTQTFDIFLPIHTKVEDYKRVKFYSESYDQTFLLLPPN